MKYIVEPVLHIEDVSLFTNQPIFSVGRLSLPVASHRPRDLVYITVIITKGMKTHICFSTLGIKLYFLTESFGLPTETQVVNHLFLIKIKQVLHSSKQLQIHGNQDLILFQ